MTRHILVTQVESAAWLSASHCPGWKMQPLLHTYIYIYIYDSTDPIDNYIMTSRVLLLLLQNRKSGKLKIYPGATGNHTCYDQVEMSETETGRK